MKSEKPIKGLEELLEFFQVAISRGTDPGSLFIELVLRAFQKRPLLASILTIMLFAAVGTSIYVDNKKSEVEKFNMEEARRATLDLNYQVNQLDKVKNGLESLITFVEDQKRKIKAEQEVLAHLQEEKSKLEPIVQTQRQILDSVLQAQEERSKREKWINLGWGFGLGILSSMVASLILIFVRRGK